VDGLDGLDAKVGAGGALQGSSAGTEYGRFWIRVVAFRAFQQVFTAALRVVGCFRGQGRRDLGFIFLKLILNCLA